MAEVKRRGRGRPRKNAIIFPELPAIVEEAPKITTIYEPEEIVSMNTGEVDLSDIEKIRPPSPPPREEPAEEIRMGHDPATFRFTPAIAIPEPPVEARGVRGLGGPAEDTKRRKDVLGKIARYKQSFEVLKAVPVDTNASVEELETKLEEMRLTISSKNTHTIFKTVYIASVKAGEIGAARFGGKLHGLADLMSKNPEVDMILKEIEAEHGITGSLKPEQRLLVATLGAAIAVDQLNRRSEILNAFTKTEVDPGIKGAFSDL